MQKVVVFIVCTVLLFLISTAIVAVFYQVTVVYNQVTGAGLDMQGVARVLYGVYVMFACVSLVIGGVSAADL